MSSKSSWLKGFIAGVVITAVFTTGIAYAGGRMTEITAYLDDMLHMTFNGEAFIPREIDGSELSPILYKDRTYLPVRAIAEKTGVYVDYVDETAEVRLKSENELLNRANLALHYIKHMNFDMLASIVHKEKGIIFSPYGYIEDDAVKLSADQLRSLLSYDEYVWGAFDGSGEPMELKAGDYWERYLYDKDYIQAERIGVDTLIQTGNTISNLEETFPGARFVEYNIPGVEPEYTGIDWSSLRLVFERSDDQWMLVGIVHDCWTI